MPASPLSSTTCPAPSNDWQAKKPPKSRKVAPLITRVLLLSRKRRKIYAKRVGKERIHCALPRMGHSE
jgi:hypothetical protein